MVVSGGRDRVARSTHGAGVVGGRAAVLLCLWRVSTLGWRYVQLAKLATTLRPVQSHSHTPRLPALLAGRTRLQKPVAGVATQRCSDLRSTLGGRSEEHTSELQSQSNLVCRLLLEKK